MKPVTVLLDMEGTLVFERLLAAGIIGRFPAFVDFDLNVVLGEVSGQARTMLGVVGFGIYAPLAQARG